MLSPLLNSLLTIQTLCTTFIGATTIRATKGHPVYLPCPTNIQPDEVVLFKWTQFGVPGISCEYTINKNYTENQKCKPEFNIRGQPPRLYVENPGSSDSGLYICFTTRIIPPPTIELNYTVDLQVTGPPNIVLKKQKRNTTCVELLCSTEYLDPGEVKFTWNRTRQGLPETLLTTKSLFYMNSSLPLCQSDWREGDIFTCIVNRLVNDTNLSEEIRIDCSEIETCRWNPTPLVIICVSSLIGVAAVIAVTLTIYKCCQRKKDQGDSVSYNNKVYENFSFSTRIRGEQKPSGSMTDQCIYEN
ncbi:uncharacterized protein LOC105010745 [Esox lucius]|uniref:uncharacterized protein LOC105010745 n=1 Tax=Esox lucius TaxID=8010 RepID=UPI001476F75B|nr:uncharacterized protein LOC105010745 [Esox lucius]